MPQDRPISDAAAFSARIIDGVRRHLRLVVDGAYGTRAPSFSVGHAPVSGHYRLARQWNCVMSIEDQQLGAVHACAVPADHLTEQTVLQRTDEMLARVLDASKAVSDTLRPWLGCFLVIEDDPFWHESALGHQDLAATRLDELVSCAERITGSRLVDAALTGRVLAFRNRRQVASLA